MSKKIVWGVVGIIVLVGVFLGGAAYGKNQTAATSTTGAAAYAGLRGGTRGGSFGGATIGQIISKDATSITVQLMTPAGAITSTTPVGSKIVLLDSSTPITKEVSGSMADLTVGTNVSVTGTSNTDGSVSAKSIQIRPNMPTATTAPSVVQ
ncbi:MAG: hypothetical protein P4L63_02555 [Candidatus Pacebacteria bacterium]|nr:hypothetical protein [Candidatus Paceibacterota bacterium]